MTRDQFLSMMHDDFEKVVKINETKGHDYAGEEDALRNFKEQAVEAGITSAQVWAVLFGKHLKAIQTFVREGDVASEPIEGRIHDGIPYLFLLLGLIREET